MKTTRLTQLMVCSKDNRNKIIPIIAVMNKMIPKKSMRCNSTLTCFGFGRTTSACVNEMMMNGKLARKIAGQSQDAIKKPPIDGPNAADVVEKIDKTARAWACFFVMLVRTMDMPLGNSVELPIA